MINNTTITSGDKTVPDLVFKSTSTGLSTGTAQQRAITTIALCNIEEPDLTDETVNSTSVNIHLIKNGATYIDNKQSLIVSNLIVPAGETVFFSDERIILDNNDTIYVGADPGDIDTAGAFNIGSLYYIETLGTTNWNTVAGTTGVTYNAGDVIKAVNIGSGDGTARKLLIVVTVSSLQV